MDEEGGMTIFYPDGKGLLFTKREDPEPAGCQGIDYPEIIPGDPRYAVRYRQ